MTITVTRSAPKDTTTPDFYTHQQHHPSTDQDRKQQGHALINMDATPLTEATPLVAKVQTTTPPTYKESNSNYTITALDSSQSQNGGSPTLTHSHPDNKTTTNANTNNNNGSTAKESGFKSFAALTGRRKYTLMLITLASFLASTAFSLLGPFYPTEAEKKGMNIGIVGFVFAIFHAVIFLTSPLYGNFLMQLGPKFVFLSGVFVAGSCNILFGTLQYCPSGTPFIVMSILIRIVEALGFSAYITASFAIVASEFKDNVGFTFGILETGSGLGFMMGPTIGGALYELGGFGLPFYVAGAAVLLNGLAVYNFLPAVEKLPTKRQGSVLTLLRSPMVVVQLGSVMVGMMGITTYDATFAKRLEPFQLSVIMIGVIFGFNAVVYSILSSIYGYITDTLDIQAPLIVVGHAAFGIGFFLIGPTNIFPLNDTDIATLLLGLACIGVSLGCALVPTMKCMVIGAVEMGLDNNIATYALVSGLFNSVNTLGGFIGPIGVGYLVQEFGFPVAYTVMGMASFCMMVVSLSFFTVRNFTGGRRSRKIRTDTNKNNSDAEETRGEVISSPRESLVNSYNRSTIGFPFSRSCSYDPSNTA